MSFRLVCELLVAPVYEREVCIVNSVRLVRTWLVLLGLVPLAGFVLSGCAQPQQPQPSPTAWDSPLPHSAKGYELYSWPAEEGQG